jgi:hypothetical protein
MERAEQRSNIYGQISSFSTLVEQNKGILDTLRAE